MADSIISFLLGNITHLLSQEANLLLGLEDQVRSLHSELKLMNSFLRNFERKRNNEQEIVTELVDQIRDLAHEAEDIIDMYVVNIAQQQGENVLAKWKLKVFQLTTRNSVARKIESIKKRIQEIYKSKDNFGIQMVQTGEPGMEDLSKKRRRDLFVEEADVVGLEDETNMIINQLTRPEPGLHVVSIIGMGGLGKTTLARKVYNSPSVRNHFSFCAWVYVSQDYKVRQLLQAIIKKCAMVFTDEMKTMDDEDLRMTLRKHLRSIKYLIVLDDVWKPEFWDELNGIFANNLQGSRIILTTRNNDVALYAKPSSGRHYLRFRNISESWELLSKKVFRGEDCPSEKLEKIGMQIAEKCRGLPLAIVVLAGILTKKENKERWWPRVLSRVSSFLAEHTEQCMDILALSYDYLPRHLKWCFLYFGVFPEDFEISMRQLIQLWIAEGFVEQKDGESMEDTAEEYLEELIDRNLIQAAKLRFDGSVKACRIHDLLRDLCILKAKKEKFLEVCRNINPSSPANSRRVGVHSNTLKYVASNPSTSSVRSFLCFGLNEGQLSKKHWKSLHKTIPLLRVLDLWGVVVECVPSEVERLIHLRYLRLKSHTAQNLPFSMCNLWNLQTLKIKAPRIDRPQIGIWKMQQLRHLYFHGQVVLTDPPAVTKKDQDNDLRNLQTLSSISPDSCTERILSRFPNLVKLGIYGDLNEHIDLVFKNVSKLNNLRTLKLERDRRFQPVSGLPDWSEIPVNITKLTLSEVQLSINPMSKLGRLPNLQVLKLTNGAYVGDVLCCASGEYPQLKVLKLINLGIKKWDVSKGSLVSLRSVVISRCRNLERLPNTLKDMSTLRELELWWPNPSILKDSREIQEHRGNHLLKLTLYHCGTP